MCRTDRENCAKNASEDCTCAESTGSGVHVDICLRGDEDLLCQQQHWWLTHR